MQPKIKTTLVHSSKLIILILFTHLIVRCVSPTASIPPDNVLPTVNVFAPASNDTILAGATEIIYDANDDQGIESIELFFNDRFHSKYALNADGARPAIFLELDNSFKDVKFNYYLVAFDLGGNSTKSVTMNNVFVKENLIPPVAPDNLEIAKLTNTILNLRWHDNSNDELGFELWRQQNDLDYLRVQTLPQGSISTNDTIPDPTHIYKYKVRAFNTFTFSESEEISTTELNLNALPAPENLSATAFGTNWVRLTWEDKSENELAFVLQRKIASGTIYENIANISPNTNQYDDRENLFSNSAYTYRIAALGQSGQSPWSNTVSISTLTFDINAPSNLDGSYDANAGVINLTWRDNSIFEIETRIERKNSLTGIFAEIGKVGENVTAYSDSTINANATYIYRVRGFVEGGAFSDYSNQTLLNTN